MNKERQQVTLFSDSRVGGCGVTRVQVGGEGERTMGFWGTGSDPCFLGNPGLLWVLGPAGWGTAAGTLPHGHQGWTTHGPSYTRSPGLLVKMQIPEPHPKPSSLRSLGGGPWILHSDAPGSGGDAGAHKH